MFKSLRTGTDVVSHQSEAWAGIYFRTKKNRGYRRQKQRCQRSLHSLQFYAHWKAEKSKNRWSLGGNEASKGRTKSGRLKYGWLGKIILKF